MTRDQIADLRMMTRNHRFTGRWVALALDEREALLAALKRALLFVGDGGLSVLLAEAPPTLRLLPTRSATAEWLMAEEEKAIGAACAAIVKAEL